MLGITVFENVKDETLLGNTGQRVTGLSEVQVDGQGYIYIPYAGPHQSRRPDARGRAPGQLPASWKTRRPDPQVSVSRAAGGGSTVSIGGQAGANGVFPIETGTRTLSTMLAKSGGVTIDPGVAIVRVTRGNHTGKIWLKDLYENPSLDIALRPGDQIVIEEDSRKFIALGATGAQSLVPFEIAHHVGAGSHRDGRRLCPPCRPTPRACSCCATKAENIARAVLGKPELIGDQRIVYVLNLTEPTGLFEARDFQIRDGDTLYVTEAPFVQWQKTIGAITGSTSAATGLADTANLNN